MNETKLITTLMSILDEIVTDTQDTLINHLILHNRKFKSKKCSLYAKFVNVLGDYFNENEVKEC